MNRKFTKKNRLSKIISLFLVFILFFAYIPMPSNLVAEAREGNLIESEEVSEVEATPEEIELPDEIKEESDEQKVLEEEKTLEEIEEAKDKVKEEAKEKVKEPFDEEPLSLELNYQVGSVLVSVSAKKGVLPNNTVLSVETLSKRETQQYARTLEISEGKSFKSLEAFDIKLLDDSGNEMQPKGKVEVSFKGLNFEKDAKTLVAYHVIDDRNFDEMEVKEENQELSFDTDSFSIYLIGTKKMHDETDPITDYLEYTIQYYYTTSDGEDVKGEMKGEVNSENSVVTFEDLKKPEDLPEGYLIDEEISTKLPFTVTEEDNEIEVYYIPGMMSIMPMALVNPGPNNYVIAPETSLLYLTGSSTNNHSQAVMAWYDAGGEFYIAVQSTHVLDGTMTLYKNGVLYASSDDTHIYPVLGNLIVDGQSYSPTVKYYSAGQIKGNTGDARWSVYVFNDANVTAGQYTFDVRGIGGGHDIEGQPLTIAIPKTDVTATKEWIGGTTPRPTIQLQLYRNILGGTPEPIGVVKTLTSGSLTATWTGLDKTDGAGKNYVFTVKEVSVPAGYQASYDGLKVTNTKVEKLNITKNVTGNFRDTSKSFKISIKFTLPQGLTNTTIRYKNPSGAYTDHTLGNDPGQNIIEIELKDGETGSFENIPYGIKYKVEENDYTAEGYDPADISNSEGTIENESISVIVTNNKNVIIDTGISLDNLPYIILLVLAGFGILGRFIWRRKYKTE